MISMDCPILAVSNFKIVHEYRKDKPGNFNCKFGLIFLTGNADTGRKKEYDASRTPCLLVWVRFGSVGQQKGE
jgi:hypothetical protein